MSTPLDKEALQEAARLLGATETARASYAVARAKCVAADRDLLAFVAKTLDGSVDTIEDAVRTVQEQMARYAVAVLLATPGPAGPMFAIDGTAGRLPLDTAADAVAEMCAWWGLPHVSWGGVLDAVRARIGLLEVGETATFDPSGKDAGPARASCGSPLVVTRLE